MDFFTHGLAPYAVVRLLGHRRRVAAAAAIGGFAPDLDVLVAWIPHLVPALAPLTHRGLTHSLWGAPVAALLALWLLTRPRIQRRAPWTRPLRWDRVSVVAATAGGVSHLLLDMLTITGVPLLWPLTTDRFGLGAFFFILPAMAIVSLAFWIDILRGRDGARRLHATLAVLGLILALSGLMRAATLPPTEGPDDLRVPGPYDWQWHVVAVEEDGFAVASYALGSLVAESLYAKPPTEATGAVAACRGLGEHALYRWSLWGPEFVEATPTPDGGWNVTFRDAVRHHMAATGAFEAFTPPWRDPDRDALRCRVAPDGAARSA